MRLLLLVGAVVVLWLMLKRMGAAAAASPTGGGESGNAGGLDNVADAMAQFEGFYQPGSLAARTNNPGDIGTFGGNVGSYADAGDGWDALNGWITSHAASNPDWDFYDMIRYYLTGSTTGSAGQGQDPDGYAEYVANYVGVDPTTPVSSVIGG